MKKLIYTFIASLLLVSCQTHKPQKTVLQGLAQGSYYAITYYDSLNRNFQTEIDSIFNTVDQSVSLWNDSSIISKVNRNEPVKLNQIFIDNFNIAQQASALSDGYFDATVSPLVAAWGFSYKNGDSITPQLVDSLKRLVNYMAVHIENGNIVKENLNITLDFNAIAQGYTSDMIAEFLSSKGIGSDFSKPITMQMLAKASAQTEFSAMTVTLNTLCSTG